MSENNFSADGSPPVEIDGFQLEKEHFDLSNKVGELVLFPEIRKKDNNMIVAAPGTSCRHHIRDGTGRIALHPAEVLYNALRK